MIGIDLFSGAGGMSLGAIQSGIDVKVVVEKDKSAIETYTFNHPNVEYVFNKDIKNFSSSEFRVSDKSNLILFGGPPCQGFSTSNQKSRNKSNSKNWLYKEFLRLVQEIEPSWVVFENVQGIIFTESGFFVKNIIKDFEALDYTVNATVLNAVDYGVPQNRSRFFLVGSKKGIKFKFPPPQTKKHLTVEDAFDGLPLLENGASQDVLPYHVDCRSEYAKLMKNGQSEVSNNIVSRNTDLVVERYKHIPQGGNWKNIPESLMKSYKDRTRCHGGIYKRLKWDEPSVVIGNYRKNMLIHPMQARGLSVREAARLQSFPDWFVFKGMLGEQQQQVGNAVPPILAKMIFEEIIKQNKEQ